MYHADLHTHTIHSDGEYTPAHLGLMALQSGIRYLAYTDHNYSYSPAELSDLRLQFPMLRILRGCEFSCFYRTADQRRVEIHIVGPTARSFRLCCAATSPTAAATLPRS